MFYDKKNVLRLSLKRKMAENYCSRRDLNCANGQGTSFLFFFFIRLHSFLSTFSPALRISISHYFGQLAHLFLMFTFQSPLTLPLRSTSFTAPAHVRSTAPVYQLHCPCPLALDCSGLPASLPLPTQTYGKTEPHTQVL